MKTTQQLVSDWSALTDKPFDIAAWLQHVDDMAERMNKPPDTTDICWMTRDQYDWMVNRGYAWDGKFTDKAQREFRIFQLFAGLRIIGADDHPELSEN